MPGILPEMGIEESLNVTRIYAVADQLPADTPLIRHRPFRAPQKVKVSLRNKSRHAIPG
jgi:magnesium chelatase family protein